MRDFALKMMTQFTTFCGAEPGPELHLISQYAQIKRQDACRSWFGIGGVVTELIGDSAQDVCGGTELEPFQIQERTSDIVLHVRWADELPKRECQPSFDSEATWKLFQAGGELTFEFTSPATGKLPYKQLRADQGFGQAELTLSRTALKHWPAIAPLEYPVSELLITNYLAHRGQGIEVHGCGIVDGKGRGHLLLGHSGAGKSTTTRLWETLRGVEILSDDRLILRQHNRELWMYGTPWHGEAAFSSPGSAKLERVFILQHGRANRFCALPKAQAVAEIFARSFVPFYSRSGVQGIVDFLTRALEHVPCYEFHFVPYLSAVEAVLNFEQSQ